VKVVHLLRHAKSSWDDEGVADHERPLAPRGRRAAQKLADRLGKLGVDPDIVLCSTALRARQTLDLIRSGLSEGVAVEMEGDLYGAGWEHLLERLRRLPAAAGSVLVVGHNPGLQELATQLAAPGPARDQLREHFPTAALATIKLGRGGWSSLAPGRAEVSAFIVPRS
jgi:phosphohistidine phosphatase